MLHRTAVEVEVEFGAGTVSSGLENTAVLNTANVQTAGLNRVVVVAGNEYVVGVVVAAAAVAASPDVFWAPTDAHIATVICVFRSKNLKEVNRARVVSCW